MKKADADAKSQILKRRASLIAALGVGLTALPACKDEAQVCLSIDIPEDVATSPSAARSVVCLAVATSPPPTVCLEVAPPDTSATSSATASSSSATTAPARSQACLSVQPPPRPCLSPPRNCLSPPGF